MNRLLYFVIFIVCAASGSAGTVASRLTEKQLFQIQQSTVEARSKFLLSAGWREEQLIHNPIFEYFGGFFDFKVERWEKSKSMDWEGTLFIYSKEGTPTLVVYQTVKDWFVKLQSANPESIQGNDFTCHRFARQNGMFLEFREYQQDATKRRYSILIYDGLSLRNLILSEQERTNQFHHNLRQGNDFLVLKRYQEAIAYFELAKKDIQPWDEDALNEIGIGIQQCNRGITKDSTVHFIREGDSFFQIGKFSESMLFYERALSNDPGNKEISKKINSLSLYLNATEIRKSEQSYAKTNPDAFRDFEAKTYQTLNNLMRDAKGEGRLDFANVIQFDSEGKNLSHLKMTTSSVLGFSYRLENLPFAELSPAKILNTYLPAREEAHFDLRWKVEKIRAEVKLGERDIENNQYSTYKYNEKINRFLDRQEYKNGIYKFEAVEKKLNGITYEDLNLVALRSNSGPSNVISSLFMPGWGTLAVTDGQKGNGRMKSFLISAAISIGCKIYSGHQYLNYQHEVPHPESYYRKADFFNKLSFIALGCSAGIYLNDIQYVIRRGLQNDRRMRSLKSRLKSGPVPLVQSQLKP